MAAKLAMCETVGMALATLRSNRLRSLLTMLGIVIGNASVITLVGVGRGAQNLAEGQLNTLGANVLFVVPGNNDSRRQGIDFPKTLVLEDLNAFGGAAGQHACLVADALGMEAVLIHPLSGLLSAYGIGRATVSASRQQALVKDLGADSLGAIDALAGNLRAAVADELSEQGVDAGAALAVTRLHLRYAGTDTTLPVIWAAMRMPRAPRSRPPTRRNSALSAPTSP